MIGYHMRFMHDDGSLAMIYITACRNDDQARQVADEMLSQDFDKVEVWRDLECIHRSRSPLALQ